MRAKTNRPLGAIILIVMLVTGCDLPQPAPTATPTATMPFYVPLYTAQPTDTQSLLLLPEEPLFTINLSMFWDDFEDDNLDIPAPPWAAGTNARGYHNVDCAFGCWLRFDGPDYGGVHDSGLRHILGAAYEGIRPNYISFNFFSWSLQDAHAGYFMLDGRIHPEQQGSYLEGIQFHVLGQQFIVNGNTYDILANWMTEWSQVEFKNIDWDASPPKFDLYVDDSLVGECISFINPIASFQWLHLYNLDTGYVGFDNILMGIGVGDDIAQAPHCDVPPPAPPPQPSATRQPSATTPPLPAPTDTLVPLVCAELNAQQCIQHSQECEWVPSLTHAGGGYCREKP